jgi:hypothetical protein
MSKDITIYFPALAGGKFIANCLFLSRHCWIKYNYDSEFVIDQPGDYNLRLRLVLSTLPTKQKIQNWLNYEFNEYKDYPYLYSRAKKKNLRCIGSMHELDENLLSNNQDIVRLVNYHKFRLRAKKIKNCHGLDTSQSISRYAQLKGSSWPSFLEFQKIGFNTKVLPEKYDSVKSEINNFYPAGTLKNNYYLVDMSVSILINWYKFSEQMKNLYLKLDLDDFNADMIKVYYDRYIDLHYPKC